MKSIKPFIPFVGIAVMIEKYGQDDVTSKDLAIDNTFWISSVIQGASIVFAVRLAIMFVSFVSC